MNFEEYAAKSVLVTAGIAVPISTLAMTPDEVAKVAEKIGGCVVKAQVPTGKRGKVGGIQLADTPEEAKTHAEKIIGMEISGHLVEKVLVEAKSDIQREFYAAILNDPEIKGPMVMFSTEGGMDIEEVAAETPETLKKAPVDVRHGFSIDQARELINDLDLGGARDGIADTLVKLYEAYSANDAELLEINPLVLSGDGKVVGRITHVANLARGSATGKPFFLR